MEIENELTLKDLYEILARYRRILLIVPLILAALAAGLVALLPRHYQAKAVLTVNLSAAAPGQQPFDLDPKLLPSAGALLSAYQQAAQQRLATVWGVAASQVVSSLDSGQDQDSGALSLSATDTSAAGAQRRALLAATDFQHFVNSAVGSVLDSSLQGAVSNLQAQLGSDTLAVTQLQKLLKATPATLPGTGQSSVRDQLQAAGVDPRYAGASDQAANPASTLLTVKLAETQARIVSEQASVERLQALIGNTAAQLSLSRQLLQVSVLGAPALPDRAQGLGVWSVAVLVYLLSLLLGMLGALLHNAVRPAPREVPARRQSSSSGVTGD